MKKIKNIFLILIFFVFILFITNKVEAVSISSSPSSPTKGQAVTITVTVPNVNTVDLTATVSGAGTSGTIRLVDGSMTGDAKTFSKSITVTPTSAGTIKVSISSSSNAVLNGNYVNNLAISKNITVSEPVSNPGGSSSGGSTSNKPITTTQPPVEVKKSTDNTLSALTIEEGQISPEFSKDVKEYAVRVAYEVTELNVTATPNDSKAKVEIIGNKDLQEGENVLTIRVTAEDGSVADYVVKVTRARIPLALKSLVIKYKNENGELIETALNPIFSYDVFEYSLEELEYWVKELSIEALPNIEGASVDIQGADSLQAGENEVTITAKISAEVAEEGEEPKEEIIAYTIKFNRKPEPTTMEKIHSWYNQNEKYVIIGALGVCVVALFGLSIYIVVDYNKYKHIVKKVKEENDFKSNNIFEDTSDEIAEEKDTVKTGKRFK